MPFELRPAIRENVPLLIGLAGGTGSGKTYSAFLLARGLAGGQRFAVIDTESGRAKAYADEFDFASGELTAPFTPEKYAEAITAIDARHTYPVIVVDSSSHEWAGEGGILDLQEEELQRMAGNDYHKRETCKMASWIKPKMSHKTFINKLLQIRAHLILCFRADPKTEMVKKDGKMVVQAKQGFTGLDGWFPICEKNMPYELTAYFLLRAERPGIPYPIKLMEKHKAFFPSDKPITEEAGRGLALWASGGTTEHAIDAQFHPRCETCNEVMAFQPAGKKTTGEAYPAFWRCPSKQHKYAITHEQALNEAASMKQDMA
jgi:hypothetical protein